MTGVREYAEGFPVEMQFDEKAQRFVIVAYNEDGFDSVAIDVLDLLRWMKSGTVQTPAPIVEEGHGNDH